MRIVCFDFWGAFGIGLCLHRLTRCRHHHIKLSKWIRAMVSEKKINFLIRFFVAYFFLSFARQIQFSGLRHWPFGRTRWLHGIQLEKNSNSICVPAVRRRNALIKIDEKKGEKRVWERDVLRLNCVVKWRRNVPFGVVFIGIWHGVAQTPLDPIHCTFNWNDSSRLFFVHTLLSMRAYLQWALTSRALFTI